MVKSAYEWHGPFKYHENGEEFWYKGHHFFTEAGYKRHVVRFKALDAIYDDDELHARYLRRITGTQIFNELPEGWHRGLYEFGGRRGLNGPRDTESAYEWCETDIPLYRNAYPGDWHRNKEYQQALVRRA